MILHKEFFIRYDDVAIETFHLSANSDWICMETLISLPWRSLLYLAPDVHLHCISRSLDQQKKTTYTIWACIHMYDRRSSEVQGWVLCPCSGLQYRDEYLECEWWSMHVDSLGWSLHFNIWHYSRDVDLQVQHHLAHSFDMRIAPTGY